MYLRLKRAPPPVFGVSGDIIPNENLGANLGTPDERFTGVWAVDVHASGKVDADRLFVGGVDVTGDHATLENVKQSQAESELQIESLEEDIKTSNQTIVTLQDELSLVKTAQEADSARLTALGVNPIEKYHNESFPIFGPWTPTDQTFTVSAIRSNNLVTLTLGAKQDIHSGSKVQIMTREAIPARFRPPAVWHSIMVVDGTEKQGTLSVASTGILRFYTGINGTFDGPAGQNSGFETISMSYLLS